MNGWLSIAPDCQGFAFFFVAAFLVPALLLARKGMRERWPLLPWLTIIAWGVTFGLIGSKLILMPAGGLLDAIARCRLPAASDKTLLGGLLGGILGIQLARRWLGFDYPVADAYALVLPLATAIGRIGCLLGGCCFGTPSSLPWAICYGPGSDALNAHITCGLVQPGAAFSLSVHPLQVYDIILMLVLALLLWKVRRFLKRSGSLFLLYIASYGIVRFGEEFIREGGSGAAGLKHVQWGLLLGIVAAMTCLLVRERSRPRPATASVRAGAIRTALAVSAFLPVIIAGLGWFTPLEFTVIGAHLVALAVAALAWLLPARHRGMLGRGAATLAAGSALLVSGDSLAGKRPTGSSYYSLYAAGSGGAYSEICGSYRRFTVGSVGLSRTSVWPNGNSVECGARGYLGSNVTDYDSDLALLYGVNPYVLLESRWVGGGLGVQAINEWGAFVFMPQAQLRIGPRRTVFVEGGWYDHVLGGVPPPMLWAPVGREFPNGSSIKAGAAMTTGIFVESSIRAWKNVELTPYCSGWPNGRQPSYHFGLALRYRFGH